MPSRLSRLARGARAAILASVACAAAPVFAASAHAASLQADFHMGDTLQAPTGQVLSEIEPGTTSFVSESVDDAAPRRVLAFPAGKGLSLPTEGLAPSGSYSVVMLFRLDPGGPRRKLLDFAGGTVDTGLYLCDGELLLETLSGSSCPGGPGLPDESYVQVVLTRDGATDEVRGYLEGVEQLPDAPAPGAAVLGEEPLRFFTDDMVTADEHAAGAVARIRVYDGVLSGDEATALDRVDVPPETAIDSGPAALSNDRMPTFAFSSPEAGARFECRHHRVGEGPPAFAPCGSPHTLGPLGDGGHVFQVRAVDPAGNPDGSAAGQSFTVDATPPQTDLTGGPGDTTAANAVFLFSSPGAGSFSCRLDGGAWLPCDSPHSYSGLSLGPHRFEVKGVDEAGNEDPSPAAHSWQVLRPGLVIPAALKQATALASELVQMRKALARVRLRTLRRRRAVTLKGFDALTGGTVELRTRARVRRRLITILVGERDIPRAGRYPIRARVTRKGRRLVRGRRKLAVELRLSFTDLAGRSLWATAKLTMRR